MWYNAEMNPRRFLSIIGPVLTVTGILGLTGVLGSISSASFFHPPYWINWFHLILGIVVITAAFKGGRKLQVGLVSGAAIVGTTLGVLGLLFGSYAATRFDIPELADPSDHVAHLIVGLLASWGWLNRKR